MLSTSNTGKAQRFACLRWVFRSLLLIIKSRNCSHLSKLERPVCHHLPFQHSTGAGSLAILEPQLCNPAVPSCDLLMPWWLLRLFPGAEAASEPRAGAGAGLTHPGAQGTLQCAATGQVCSQMRLLHCHHLSPHSRTEITWSWGKPGPEG